MITTKKTAASIRKQTNKRKCWLCGQGRPDSSAEVGRTTPAGPECKPHLVRVHLACWMDMDA